MARFASVSAPGLVGAFAARVASLAAFALAAALGAALLPALELHFLARAKVGLLAELGHLLG